MADATNTLQRTNENQQFRIKQVITNLAREIQMIQNGVQAPFIQNLYQTQQDIDANEDFEDYQEVLTDDEIIQNQTPLSYKYVQRILFVAPVKDKGNLKFRTCRPDEKSLIISKIKYIFLGNFF